MPIRTVPEVGLTYYLACVDGTGEERTDDPDGINGRMIPRVTDALAKKAYTDVFLMSHGWMGDVPAAIRQYDRWIGAMATCKDDMERASRVRPGFRPLLVGIHWPSLPYGDEELSAGAGVSFSTPGAGAAAVPDTAVLIDAYADRIANTPAARKALETIFAAAALDTAPPELSPEVVEAYWCSTGKLASAPAVRRTDLAAIANLSIRRRHIRVRSKTARCASAVSASARCSAFSRTFRSSR